MRSPLLTAAVAVALAATGCTSDTTTDDVPEGMDEMEEYEETGPDSGSGEEMGDGVADLGSTHDFGDGVTIAMVDLRREIAEDGFNSSTGEEGDLPYVAWSWELTNDTGAALPLGGTTVACFTGDPLAEAEQPHLGDSLNPPDMLADGQTATWDADCWMGEDETALQYTLDLYTPDSEPLYTVTFVGDVPA
ncbi:hypothetical protein KIK06_23325 [Nocardiopsis sp. EMB25]|uniref:hypothetical protein n=1 Tax=Nocardiopsis sp. EMB25 TaxID=2835867 RepID=UPI002283C4AD|nr:hypothetical protein [Nocardiopsis sp. EMB25]MCY9786818.1 hypothetical protein [Nocardiopsis sp. EMB25]